jgi:hypothetical protein
MNRGKYRWNSWDLLQKLADVPQEIGQWVKGKANTLSYEIQQLEPMQGIQIREENVILLRSKLMLLERELDSATPAKGNAAAAAHLQPLYPSAEAEKQLLQHIRKETEYRNRNNVTRTQAYWDLYVRRPELHWALLAHMVSRNGGWCMTDLKGELLPYLLNETQTGHIFTFLERANALIFHDAYPQLLLYEASLRAKRPLFHLLGLMNISVFMRPVWELFWERRDSALLTTALIINEQHYIEERVVQNPLFRKYVIDTLFFNAQSLLQLNQIVFPYVDEEKLRLAGLVLEDFSNLNERIEIGKKLYALLFGIPIVFQGVKTFAERTRHTASRADYWPHLFAPIRKAPPVPRGQLKEWLDGCSLRPGASPLYSPPLEGTWRDLPVAEPEPGDWFHKTASCISYVTSTEPPFSFEMTHEYCFGLNKIELAVLAGDLIK